MTAPEVMLWTRLRGGGGETPIFRRQHAMGPYILDFYCSAARLAVEVDGATHWNDDAMERDTARDRWLACQGVTVMRLPAAEIYRDVVGAADAVVLKAMGLIHA